jgi:hypothetical protein
MSPQRLSLAGPRVVRSGVQICRRIALLGLLALAVPACRPAAPGDAAAIETVEALSELTDEIVETVKDAADKRAGVAAAQQLLDTKARELGPPLKTLMARPSAELGEQARGHVAKVLVEQPAKLVELEIEVRAAHPDDEGLAAALAELVADHRALTRGL